MTVFLMAALLSSWSGDLASGNWISLGGDFQGEPAVELLEADGDHAVLRLELPGYGVQSVLGYTRFDIPGYGPVTDSAVGDPEFPAVPVVVGLPSGMEPSLTVIQQEWIPAGSGRPYPVQPPIYDDETEPFPFAELSGGLHGEYPSSPVSLGATGTWAGANTATVVVSPFRWNADTGVFQAASSITVRVDFTGQQGYQCPVRQEIASMHRSRIINYDSLQIPVDTSPVTSDDNVYICVVPPDNLETITPLLAMVNSLGHHVYIIEMEEGSTSYLIKNAINGAYQPGITRFALIPARHQQLESKLYNGFVGDFYYECLDADNLPDIAVGRYPGNWTQLENQTAKTMSYVSYAGVPGQPSISASVILAAHEEDYPGKYTANSNAVKNWSYALADPVFETCYPPEGGTAEQVSDAIDGGVGIVNYRGHGSNTTWQWSPGWNAGSIYGLENTFFPPVFNVCCSNGNHAEVYNCLCESWMDGPGVGTSGNLGASTASLTIVNDRFQRVLFWELFDEGNTCAGEMFAAAQTDIIQTQGGGGLSNSRMYHWFGDPSMDICNSDLPGAPFPLEVDAPSAVNTGENNLVLTATSGGSPVEGAVITVTDGIGNHPSHTETFYVQGITDAGGQAVLSFTAVEGNDLYYGVRLHDHAAVTGTIEVTTQGIEGGSPAGLALLPVSPSPAETSARVSYQAPPGVPLTIRVLDISGRTRAVLLDRQSTGGVCSLDMDTSAMAPGIYFVVMQSGGSSFTEKMAVVR